MRTFSCDTCAGWLVFENSVCVTCDAAQHFSPAAMRLVVDAPGTPCANLGLAGCNWLVDEADGGLCLSCRLTRTRPADGDVEGLTAFATAERAKRRLIYQLLDLGLPLEPAPGRPRLAFDLLSGGAAPVVTGHADGVITIDLAEGHDAHREAMRMQLDEPYRTMLGHFRHEIGHYYWQVLIGPGPRFREAFGDERADYTEALHRHYEQGAPDDWPQAHVSAYAAAHPWEDWAETFAHYLHIRATLQSAAAYGMVVTGPEVATAAPRDLVAFPAGLAPRRDPIEDVIATWLPLTYALNAVNRSMGHADLYPFVLSPVVIAKLGLVHELVTATVGARG